MTNVRKLDIAILNSNLSRKEIAKALQISSMGFYKKAKAKTEFKASEIVKMKKILNLSETEAQEIFFSS